MDSDFLIDYFANHWKPSIPSYKASSYTKIASEIADTEHLLDVGCGSNPFKQLVKNCTGIDPANDGADIKVSIENFEPPFKYDVVACLGSINFGDEDVISQQIEKVVSCLKEGGRIYWRLNPGRQDHASPLCSKIVFFPWTFEKLKEFADKHGFTQKNERIDKDDTNPSIIRLYAEWHHDSKITV